MSEIKSKSIEMIDISAIVPNPKNANQHPPEQIARLEKLISYQGFRNPLIVSNRTGFLVVGHGRLEAAKNLGIDKLPVIKQDFESEAQEYAYLISDNEIARWAELDNDAVYEELKNIDLDDIELLGLEDFELPDIEQLDPQADEDDVPEVENPITKRGDIWLLGKHRLMCGDSTMIDDVERLMKGEKADMLFTDPPYGISYKSNYSKRFDELKNDDEFLDIRPVIEIVLDSKAPRFIWTSHQVYHVWKEMFIDDYKSTIIWYKKFGGMGDLKAEYGHNYEMCLHLIRDRIEFTGDRPKAVWEVSVDDPSKYQHPTQKPVDLCKTALTHYDKTKSVLDLFGGSGSTLIACEDRSTQNYSMELDEKYCDVIINRWQNYTGKRATLEATGQTYEELVGERS